MATWPGTLPQSQFVGLIDQDVDAVLRTPMDQGPPTRRRKYAAIVREVDVPIVLTGTQRIAFDTFYRTTLRNGSLAFDWEDPVTDVTISFAFRAPPRWLLDRGGSSTANRIWSTTLQLQVQP